MPKTSLESGQVSPDFCLPNQEGNQICLENFKGQWAVLFFYPRDNTPGCSLEARSFSDLKKDFEAENAIILGELKITLLSDEKAEIHEKYDVMHPKNFRGNEVISTVRTTFLINPEGKIEKVWNNVKAAGHAEKVLSELKTLKGK